MNYIKEFLEKEKAKKETEDKKKQFDELLRKGDYPRAIKLWEEIEKRGGQ